MAVERMYGLVCVYNTVAGRGRVKTDDGVLVGYISEYWVGGGQWVFATFQHNPRTGLDDLIGERRDFADAMGLFDASQLGKGVV